MKKGDVIEKDYWWEIKYYLENPSKETFLHLLEKLYEDGYKQARYDYGNE